MVICVEVVGIYYQTPMYVDFWGFFIEQPERSKKQQFLGTSRRPPVFVLDRSIFDYVLLM